MVAVPSQEKSDEATISFFTDPNSTFYQKLPDNWNVGGLSAGSDSVIDHLYFSSDGNQIVSSSKQGTCLRVVDCTSKQVVKEVCRGSKAAGIYSLSLDKKSSPNLLVCSSDRKTVHLFKIPGAEEEDLVNSLHLDMQGEQP